MRCCALVLADVLLHYCACSFARAPRTRDNESRNIVRVLLCARAHVPSQRRCLSAQVVCLALPRTPPGTNILSCSSAPNPARRHNAPTAIQRPPRHRASWHGPAPPPAAGRSHSVDASLPPHRSRTYAHARHGTAEHGTARHDQARHSLLDWKDTKYGPCDQNVAGLHSIAQRCHPITYVHCCSCCYACHRACGCVCSCACARPVACTCCCAHAL